MKPNRRTANIQRRLAADLLKCGIGRIWMDPEASEKIKKAITRNDVRGLIKDDLIKKLPVKKKKSTAKKSKQRTGSRKGSKGARRGKKERWLKAVRPQRRLLKELKDGGELRPGAYRKMYMRIKGGSFRSKAHLQLYLKEKKLLKKK